ncbi:BQ5605_C032g11106 [Microbotryum silenes-dioicae]|uniref:BQ5605_C032g11106 protein n=1 Tax=Microbotryum silenes-dioicae TaxID=796604 RepID=A0A2X0NAD2_9BASI|nr:BQ5605_C032g11106 [Microbotryum silenes-dioicae]
MSPRTKASEDVLDREFDLCSAPQRSCMGYVCLYCGGERMPRSRAVRHATTKRHLRAVLKANPTFGSRSDRWPLSRSPPLPRDDDEMDWADIEEPTFGTAMVSQPVSVSGPSSPGHDTQHTPRHNDFDLEFGGSPSPLGDVPMHDNDAEVAPQPVHNGADSDDQQVEAEGSAVQASVPTDRLPACDREGVRNYSAVPAPSHPWYPFPSEKVRQIAMVPTLYAQQELDNVLDLATALGLRNLPAASTVEKFLHNLQNEVPLYTPTRHTKEKGRVLHVLSPQNYVAAHFASPAVAPLMHYYPDLKPSNVNSAYHTRRWLSDLPARFSAPMARVDKVDYFVDEIVVIKGVPDMHWFVARFASLRDEIVAFVCLATVSAPSSIEVKLPAFGRPAKDWPTLCASSWCVVPVERFERPVLEHRAPDVCDPATNEIQRSLPLRSVDRALANGELLLVTPLRLFLDDMAATESSRWNPMYTASVQNLALPASVIKRRFMLHHTGVTGTDMGALDLAEFVLTAISDTLGDRPMQCYSVAAGEEVLVRTPLLCSIHDSPMAAECAAQARGWYPCLHCPWGEGGGGGGGGALKTRLTVDQMMTFFECPGLLDAETIRDQALEQLETYANELVMVNFSEQQTSTGTHDVWTKRCLAELAVIFQKEMTHETIGDKGANAEVLAFRAINTSGKDRVRMENRARGSEAVRKAKAEMLERGDYVGPFFDVPCEFSLGPLWAISARVVTRRVVLFTVFDPHKHMPPDILHVFFLGIVKYAGKATLDVDELKKGRRGHLSLRAIMSSMSPVGLPGGIATDHLIDYQGSLVGYDFVTLAQVMPLVAQLRFDLELMPLALNECWGAIGKLGHHLHTANVADLDTYATECEHLVNNLLQASMRRNLSHVLNKSKYHALANLVHAIRMFGPPRLFDASLAESANKVIRQHSMRTNHFDVSQDIARKLGDTERVGFITRGGTWKKDGNRVSMGPAARRLLEDKPAMREWLLLESDAPRQDPSAVRYKFAAGSPFLSDATQLAKTVCFSLPGRGSPDIPRDARWRKAKLAILPNGDPVHPQDWCLFRSDGHNPVLVGQVIELLARESATGRRQGLVGFRLGRIGEELASTGFRTLSRGLDRIVVSIEVSMCRGISNVVALAVVQHNCTHSGCWTNTVDPLPVRTTHKDTDEFLLSTITHRSFDELAAFRPPIKQQVPTEVFVRALLASPTAQALLAAAESADENGEEDRGKVKGKGKSLSTTWLTLPVHQEPTPLATVDEQEECAKGSEEGADTGSDMSDVCDFTGAAALIENDFENQLSTNGQT